MEENISERALQAIHGETNYWKSLAYWVGFLKGVVSSGAIEKGELPALKSHCEEFLSTYADHDAADLIQDLEIFENDDEELISLVSGIINERSDASEYNENAKTRNEFYGFLKGIACDGVITVKEIKKLNQYINTNQAFKEDYKINDIKLVCECALEDGIIDIDESNEICAYISKIVGDSYADTGISTSRDIPALEGMLQTLEEYDFQGKEVVLTGTFCMFKRKFWEFLEKQGATAKKGITKNTDLLICSEVGSEHYITPNAGTKILTAIEYRVNDGRPEFAMEHMLLRLMENT